MNERETVDLASAGKRDRQPQRSFLVVYTDGTHSRVIELPDDAEVTFGRSRGSTVVVDDERVSRLHARVISRAGTVTVEDAGSRNGTLVNGDKIDGPRRLRSGDEIAMGPCTAVVNQTTRLHGRPVVGSTTYLDERLAAEVDRSQRYHRPLGLMMLRIEGDQAAADAALDRISAVLRRMDSLAEYGPDELAIVFPEADRPALEATARRVVRAVREDAGLTAHVGLAFHPDDGTHAGELISRARAALQAARHGVGEEGVARAPVEAVIASDEVVIADPQMRKVYDLARRIAEANIGVLILGETGVGKELVAEELHRKSGRAGKPMVKLNCASLPETLLESELFGHERGAFTGAEKRKIGYFEAAHGGTIFLDEIGELPVSLQPKLLRVLERHTIVRVGGTAEIEADVRVVCATNRDLEEEVRRGQFREDLFFRVSAFTIVIPPLRDRRIEIPLLADAFVRRFAAENHLPPPVFTADARWALERHSWPGNVRELRNAVERAVVLCTGGTIDREHLPDRVAEAGGPGDRDVPAGVTASAHESGAGVDVREQIAEVERSAIVLALEACGGNQTRAAQKLGLSRRALIYKLEKYGLKPLPASSR